MLFLTPFAPFLTPITGIIAVVLGITLTQPKRPGEIVPTWFWVILFVVNTTMAAGLLAVLIPTLLFPRFAAGGTVFSIVSTIAFVAAIALTPYLLSKRQKLVEDTDITGRPKTLEGRMEARRARVEKARKEGRL